jgi:hypothetical protein
MEKIKTLGLTVTILILVFGCTKLKDPAGRRNVGVVPVISNVAPGIFDSKDLVNSYVQFVVDLPAGSQADGAAIEASYNNNSERIQVAQVTSFPGTVKIISGDVLQKLGLTESDVSNGDVFTLELVTTVNGIPYRSNAVLFISVACAFDKALTIGSYHSVSADWNTSGNVTLTDDPNNPYTIYVAGLETLDGLDEDKGPLVMHIDPVTFAVTADKTVLASAGFGYHNIAYSGTGTYSSCDGSYAMSFDISVDEGDFGKFTFNMTKNP